MNTQDQIAVIILGSVGILFVGGVTQAPFLYSLCAVAGFIAATALYMRVTQSPGTDQAKQSREAGKTSSAAVSFGLAAAFTEAIITIGERGEIINANPAAQKLFSAATPGASYTRIVRQPEILSVIESALRGQNPAPVTYKIETPILRHLRVTATPIKAASSPKDNQRVIIVFYDITDIMVANTLRSDFLANASHELKTPIASILGYIETLRGHAKDDKDARERFLVIMQQQAERMQRLITDLLSLRRIEQVEHIAPSTRGDLYLAAKAAKESLMPFAKEKDVKISFENKLNLLVTGVQDELVQLVLNLVDNAVQMSPPGSKVKVSFETISEWRPGEEFSRDPLSRAAPRRRIVGITEAEGGFAIIRIRDQGPGFDREHLPRLGERFYRVIGDRSSREKGTGLGLAIVKHIVRRHRGGLFIESAKDIGTEFSIFIPLASE